LKPTLSTEHRHSHCQRICKHMMRVTHAAQLVGAVLKRLARKDCCPLLEHQSQSLLCHFTMADVVTVVLEVTGCADTVDAGLVRGKYSFWGWNHGKPAYKKQSEAGGVFFYFWCDCEEPGYSGWWFGPTIGDDHVYAFHPEQEAGMPPSAGWMLLSQPDMDPTLVILPAPPVECEQQQPQLPPLPPTPPSPPTKWRRHSLRKDGRTRTHMRYVR
jgi:hypothetical protein